MEIIAKFFMISHTHKSQERLSIPLEPTMHHRLVKAHEYG